MGSRSASCRSVEMKSPSTLSIAVPGSVIDNAQTAETASILAGQIARAAVIYRIDEIVVLDDTQHTGDGRLSHGTAFLARALQYLETPQYLRRELIPMHDDLRYAGLLPPLDAPHHMRADEWSCFREAVVLRSQPGKGAFLNAGLGLEAHVDQALKAGARVTIKLGKKPSSRVAEDGSNVLLAKLSSPVEARRAGHYWGYRIRIAASLLDMVTLSPFQDGYDLMIGTSEHGKIATREIGISKAMHTLVAFGGPHGLEDCFAKDDSIPSKDPSATFMHYINTCPHQGSRTIRTEEAILISLAYLQQLNE